MSNIVIQMWLTQIIRYIIPLVEACGALVIILEVARTIIRYLYQFFKPGEAQIARLRLHLGQSMVVGLEFQVAADILKTAVSPTWEDILRLAALIALRTILNYLLEYELKALNAQCGPLATAILNHEADKSTGDVNHGAAR
ncbi:MAG TPA: DUF1622 domain-containing protein [Chloroflexi bacterium]|nr:DUF1622 domain-containing protein [Chloroflexota bacterium]